MVLEMTGRISELQVVMRAEKRQDLPDRPDGRHQQDLIQAGKAQIHDEGKHPCRVIRQQFRCQKNRLGSISEKRCKLYALTKLTHLLMIQIL